jgi:uncharacterized SAM-binding protein YcdF (DUF218 family)
VARILRGAGVLALSILVLGLILYQPLLAAIGSYLVHAQPPTKADIAVVLSGDGRGNRILKAAELVKQGYVPRALISGPDGAYGLSECDLAIPFAVKAGYPESYFQHFENTARSTELEAEQVVAELRRQGAHSVLVVTSDYHTRRSGRMYRNAAPEMEFTVIAAPDGNFTVDAWWRNREGRKTTLYEWMKTVASWFGI